MSRGDRIAITLNTLAAGYLLGTRWPSDAARGAAFLVIIVVAVWTLRGWVDR